MQDLNLDNNIWMHRRVQDLKVNSQVENVDHINRLKQIEISSCHKYASYYRNQDTRVVLAAVKASHPPL